MFKLSQDRIISRAIEEGLDGQEVFHQLRNGRQGIVEFWRPQRSPRLKVLSNQHPTPVDEGGRKGTCRLERCALVRWIQAMSGDQTLTFAVEINAQDRFLIGCGKVGIQQRWHQRTTALDKVHTAACSRPCVRHRTGRSSAAAHAEHGTAIRTPPRQAGKGHHAQAIGSCRVHPIVVKAQRVDASQCLSAVGAVPVPDLMLKRGGQTHPPAATGNKTGRIGPLGPWFVGNTGHDSFVHTRCRLHRRVQFLKHTIGLSRLNSDDTRGGQPEAHDPGLLQTTHRQEGEQRRSGCLHGMTRHRVQQPGHKSPKPRSGLRLWAAGIGK